MKPPTCKVCQKAHWTYDGHFVSGVVVPAYIKEMAKGALGGDAAPFVDHLSPQIKRTEPINGRNKRTRGRPKKWGSEAERKRAYRERSK